MALDEVPSRGKIKASVSEMNNNKAPGMGGITAEILKNGGEKMIDLLKSSKVYGKVKYLKTGEIRYLCLCIRKVRSRTAVILGAYLYCLLL